MLRLIVLGDLPGTDVNLTFLQVLLLLGLLYGLVYRHRHQFLHRSTPEA